MAIRNSFALADGNDSKSPVTFDRKSDAERAPVFTSQRKATLSGRVRLTDDSGCCFMACLVEETSTLVASVFLRRFSF